jgi:hypothetical protein
MTITLDFVLYQIKNAKFELSKHGYTDSFPLKIKRMLGLLIPALSEKKSHLQKDYTF